MKRGSSPIARVALVLSLAVSGVAVYAQAVRPATAVATVSAGYVVGVELKDGGAGYGMPPAVTFSGGAGSGAVAETKLRNGVVDQIVLINTGSGYSAQTGVQIAAPQMPVLESVRFRIGLTVQGRLGETHQIRAADGLVPATWQVRTNAVVTHSPYVWLEERALVQQRYYQVVGETEVPVLGAARWMGELTIHGTVGTTNYILATDVLVRPAWRVLTNLVVASSPYVWVDEASPRQRYYQTSATPEVPVEKMDPLRWVWIPPGMFTMGSPYSERARWWFSEGPQKRVTLTKGFWMGRYEVTQREYAAVIGNNPSWFKAPAYPEDLDRPVETVSWYQATNYCGKLTARERAAGRLPTGYAYRLPTEAEWEYACRAGTTTRYSFGDALECDDMCGFCSVLDSYMWWCGNSSGGTHRVGGKLPNGWGLYDMHGNVWEWCGDWWMDLLPDGAVTDPKGPDSGSNRLIRGGFWDSWLGHANGCRSACRYSGYPAGSGDGIGFRVVLAPSQP